MGTWNETQVALKVLTTQAGISPSSAVRCRSEQLCRYWCRDFQAIRREIQVRTYHSKYGHSTDIWSRRLGHCYDIPTSYVICLLWSGCDLLLMRTISFPQSIEFLGANELDDRPFIVMPYLKNGNARDYIQSHPDCERLRIVCLSLYFTWSMSDKSSKVSPHLARSRVPPLTKDCSWWPQRRKYHQSLVMCISFDGRLLAQCANRR